MSNWSASSVVVAAAGRIVAGARAVRRATRSFFVRGREVSTTSVWVARLVLQADRVTPIADGSRLLQAIERLFERAAGARAGVLARALNWSEGVEGTRVRLAGWLMLGAATTHVSLTGTDVGLGWIAAIPVTLACICRPLSVLAAWKSSRLVSSWARRIWVS